MESVWNFHYILLYFVLNSIITIPISKYYEVGKVTRKKLPCDLALQAFKFIANSSDTFNIVWKILSIQFISKNTFGLYNKQYIKLFACQVNNQFSHYTKVRNKASATIPTINSAQKTLIAVDAILITLRLSLLRTHTIERIRPSRTKSENALHFACWKVSQTFWFSFHYLQHRTEWFFRSFERNFSNFFFSLRNTDKFWKCQIWAKKSATDCDTSIMSYKQNESFLFSYFAILFYSSISNFATQNKYLWNVCWQKLSFWLY